MNVLNIIKEARGEKQATMLEAHGREVAQIESADKFKDIESTNELFLLGIILDLNSSTLSSVD